MVHLFKYILLNAFLDVPSDASNNQYIISGIVPFIK